MRAPLVALVLMSSAAAPARADEPPAARQKLAVLRLAPNGVELRIVEALTSALVNELARDPALEIISSADIAAMLNAEQQRQLVGCDSSSCLVELGGALGAARVVTGSVDRLGSVLVLNAQLLDVGNARVLRRATERLQTEDELLDGAARVAAQLRGLAEPPPAPSRGGDPARRLTVELGSELPLATGLRVRKCFAPGLTLSLGVGPQLLEYAVFMIDASNALGRLDDVSARLLRRMDHAPIVLEPRVGWDFGEPRGLRAELGVAFVVNGDARPDAASVDEIAPAAVPSGVRPDDIVQLSFDRQLVTGNVAWEWTISPGWTLTASLGFAIVAGANVSEVQIRGNSQNQDEEQKFIAATRQAFQDRLGRMLTPFVGVAVGYEP